MPLSLRDPLFGVVVLKVFQFCGCILVGVSLGFLYRPFLTVTQVVFGMFSLQFLRFGEVLPSLLNSFPVLCLGCLTK